MEELIHHFIVVTQGIDAPPGEVYFGAENPKGELGFYIYSKGGGTPYRLKIRAPSFVNLSILSKLLPGHMMSDVVAILGSFDFVMGECDDSSRETAEDAKIAEGFAKILCVPLCSLRLTRPMSFLIPPELESKMDEVITHYPVSKRSAVLPLLHLIQHHFRFINDEAVTWVANKLGLEPIQVLEVVTFYPGFRQTAPGKYHIRVCRTLSCAMAGSYELMESLCKTANIDRSHVGSSSSRSPSAPTANTASSSPNASRAAAPAPCAWWRMISTRR